MTARALFIFFVFSFSLSSCINEHDEIDELVHSENATDIVKGYYLVGEYKRTEFIKSMFINEKDERISHHLRFKGISVYQGKMGALRKIYNINSPHKITYRYDSVVVSFYKDWSYKSGYLN